MSDIGRHKGLVLAVHPTARGFGWVLFEAPLVPVDWGIAFARQGRNERLMKRFDRLLSRYEPSVLVMEEFEKSLSRRAGITERLCRSMIHNAKCRGMDTHTFRLSVIRSVFATAGASTRYEIAEIVRQQIAAFSHRMPRKRTLLVREDPKQSLFDAAAAALTYFAVLSERP
jgi:hypothetical protein